MRQSDLICVKEVPGKGRGVFARKPIKKGTIIESVPVLLVPLKDLVAGKDNPFLNKYMYVWSKTAYAISLGYGSLYNHSYEPNARYVFGAMRLTYKAERDIAKGEEITINYNYYPGNRKPVGFEVVS